VNSNSSSASVGTSAIAPNTLPRRPCRLACSRQRRKTGDQHCETRKSTALCFRRLHLAQRQCPHERSSLRHKFFTPEIRADVDYVYDFAHPKDDTIGGSSEIFRSNEVHVTQLGVGGDFHYDNVRARLMTQFGLYSQTTPRNDASPSRGQWNLDNAIVISPKPMAATTSTRCTE